MDTLLAVGTQEEQELQKVFGLLPAPVDEVKVEEPDVEVEEEQEEDLDVEGEEQKDDEAEMQEEDLDSLIERIDAESDPDEGQEWQNSFYPKPQSHKCGCGW